jgi:predicted enzyme related to lactoylglutathione lyase
MLQFDVLSVQDSLLLALSNGGTMDGPVKHPAHGKVVVVKDPSGRRVGMWEKVGDMRDVTGGT